MPDQSPINFPLVIIGGLPRTGTTFLYHNLGKHPKIFVPYRKEPNFFNLSFDRGLNWYLQMFKGIQPGQYGLDGSAGYVMHPDSLRNIKKLVSHAKVIIGVRKPSDWGLSLFSQISTHTVSMPPFEEFIENYNYNIEGKIINYKLNNLIHFQTMCEFATAFGKDLMIFDYEILKNNSLQLLQEIEEFLGIERFFSEGNFDNQKINAAGRSGSKWLNMFLNLKMVKNILNYVPRELVVATRSRFDKISSQMGKESKVLFSDEMREISKNRFKSLDLQVKHLFEKKPILYGTELSEMAWPNKESSFSSSNVSN